MKWVQARRLAPILGAAALFGSPACAHVPTRNPLPAADADIAQVAGIPYARYWGDSPPPWNHLWLARTKQELRIQYPAVYGRPVTFLAISGGGENGAFAAGLLLGWTARGDRPEFTTVTGVSAGALIAPFAFLGPEYDHVLRRVTLELEEGDIAKERRIIQGLRSDGMASTAPLKALIAQYVDQTVVDKIAEEYRRGRQLNIGTSNLDSMRPVVWRIGEIANSGYPRALDLIRQVLLASASVPAAFSPVLIQVEANGQSYDELHVDGGATSQVFLYPIGVDFDDIITRLKIQGRPKVYVIRNARLSPTYEAVPPKTIPIGERSVSSLVRAQGIGDLYRIYIQTYRDGLDYNLAYVPDSFTDTPKGTLDSAYMKKVFHLAFDLAKEGYPWQKVPPELEIAPIKRPAR